MFKQLISSGLEDVYIGGNPNIGGNNVPKIRKDKAYLQYMAFEKYNVEGFINKFLNALPVLRRKMPITLYKTIVLEMLDIMEYEYWYKKLQGRVILEFTLSLHLPRPLLLLLATEVSELYDGKIKSRSWYSWEEDFPIRQFPHLPYEPLYEQIHYGFGPQYIRINLPRPEVNKEETIPEKKQRKVAQKQMQKDLARQQRRIQKSSGKGGKR